MALFITIKHLPTEERKSEMWWVIITDNTKQLKAVRNKHTQRKINLKVSVGQSVQSLSHVWLFATPWTAGHQESLSKTNFRSLPKLMSIESVVPSNHLILCCPLLLLPSIFPNIRSFQMSQLFTSGGPTYWSFRFSISPSNEYSGLTSFRTDWLDLLAVQGTCKSLLPTPQFKSINSSVLSSLYRSTLTSIHDHWKKHSLN